MLLIHLAGLAQGDFVMFLVHWKPTGESMQQLQGMLEKRGRQSVKWIRYQMWDQIRNCVNKHSLI